MPQYERSLWPKAKLEARLDGSKYLLPRYESAQRALRLQDQKKNEQVVKYKETYLWERSPEERAASTYSFSSPNFRLHIILSWAGGDMMFSPWILLKCPFLFTENLQPLHGCTAISRDPSCVTGSPGLTARRRAPVHPHPLSTPTHTHQAHNKPVQLWRDFSPLKWVEQWKRGDTAPCK